MTDEELSFPRQSARTLRFTLGAPRNFTPSPDGSRIAFLRAPSGTDRATQLWVYDVESRTERLIADPVALLSRVSGRRAGEEELSPEERARRERLREGAGGIVGYATDRDVRVAAFSLSSRLWLADLVSGEVRELPAAGPVFDPRPSPDGTLIAYASGGALRLVAADGSGDRNLAGPETASSSAQASDDGPDASDDGPVETSTVVWGRAEFIASEELSRFRGFWWAPHGHALLVERYDEAPVQVWTIADPANPERPPTKVRYPAAGTANADVSLWLVGVSGEPPIEVQWDRERFPYLAEVSWPESGAPLLYVLTRDQRTAHLLGVVEEVREGGKLAVELVHEEQDDAWVEVLPGVPTRLPDGRTVTTISDGQTRRLAIDGQPVTPEGLQVGGVLDVSEQGLLVQATTEPTERHVYRIGTDGSVTCLTSDQGVHTARAAGPVTIVSSQSLDFSGVRVRVMKDGIEIGQIASLQADPPFTPEVSLLRLGSRELRTAVLFPRDHVRGTTRLPLLLDPYGGPHAQRVLSARAMFLASQWLADQGFCVVVADGRGTPARGPAWEHQVLNDFVSTLDDQVEVVHQIAEVYPDDVDLGRIAIRGWSYGGYLAALAVLERPDVFHAAVAGAPVAEWRLYDTAYTERYLGDPNAQPDVYDRNSLLTQAAKLERPLLLIHGLADDNVVAAHTLRLSSALLAAGRPHTVLPLSGVTHMTPQEVVAENLLHLELDFLRRALS